MSRHSIGNTTDVYVPKPENKTLLKQLPNKTFNFKLVKDYIKEAISRVNDIPSFIDWEQLQAYVDLEGRTVTLGKKPDSNLYADKKVIFSYSFDTPDGEMDLDKLIFDILGIEDTVIESQENLDTITGYFKEEYFNTSYNTSTQTFKAQVKDLNIRNFTFSNDDKTPAIILFPGLYINIKLVDDVILLETYFPNREIEITIEDLIAETN